MAASIGTPSLLLSSATRSDSCLPPPFVSNMKGMCCDWRNESALCARGSVLELRTSTPSILTAVSRRGRIYRSEHATQLECEREFRDIVGRYLQVPTRALAPTLWAKQSPRMPEREHTSVLALESVVVSVAKSTWNCCSYH